VVNSTEHQKAAYDAALQGIALLKNDKGTLPLTVRARPPGAFKCL
jgi:beta-glucosidase-like glycosyl hydrolase